MHGTLKFDLNLKGLSLIKKKTLPAFTKALEVAAIQWLTWANNGSPNTSLKPPIRWGVMRGSSSAFVGSKMVLSYNQTIANDAEELPTPALSYGGKDLTVTWVWNTDYATKMHEWKGSWGKFTIQDTNAGAKWAEEHLEKDRKDFLQMVSVEAKKGLGT